MRRIVIGRRLAVASIALLVQHLPSASAQSFQISNASINSQGKYTVSFPSDPSYYFILNHGLSVMSITSPVAMVLGQSGGGQMTDTVAAVGTAFFTVQKVPLSAPHDTDGDGIDDVYELQHGLNPLNPGDAALDSDGDGVSNYNEYRRGTDPKNAASVNTFLYADSVAGNDSNDGLAATPTPWFGGTHAPKQTIQGAISAGISGDTVSIASGTYHDTLLSPGNGSVVLAPQGNVTIQ